MPSKRKPIPTPRRRVLTPEELIARDATLAGIPAQMTGTKPVFIEAPPVPLVEKPAPEEAPHVFESPKVNELVKAVRIESQPVSVTPTDQTPQEALDLLATRKVKSVADLLNERGINPIDELMMMYEQKDEDPVSPSFGKFIMSPSERRNLMKEMLKYIHPQLKSIDHTGAMGGNKLIVVLQMPDGTNKTQEIAAKGTPIDVG